MRPSRKLRIVHCGDVNLSMMTFCKHVDLEKFDVHAVVLAPRQELWSRLKNELSARCGLKEAIQTKQAWLARKARLKNLGSILGIERVARTVDSREFNSAIDRLAPDVIHAHDAVPSESAPLESDLCKRVPVIGGLPAPVEVPCSPDSLRSTLGIPQDAFVVGGVEPYDPTDYDPIALKAYRQIENQKTYFIALSPPDNMLRQAESLLLRNFIPLPSLLDEVSLSKFYNTIDVFAHGRRGGDLVDESVIQAMIHAKPVVTHALAARTVKPEAIGKAGFVCEQNDWREYAERLVALKEDPLLRAQLATQAQRHAMENFEARAMTHRIEKVYVELAATKS